MISTSTQRVKISQVVQNHLPQFVSNENPLFVEFLKSYYVSQDHPGGPADLAENLDYYTKLDSLVGSALSSHTRLSYSIQPFTKNIVVNSTAGFPESYGLIKIDNEIITYTGLSATAPRQTFTVTIQQSEFSGEDVKFFINGIEARELNLKKGGTYIFDQSDSSNVGYDLRISTTQDGIWNGGVAYTTGVTVTGDLGSTRKTRFVVPESAPNNLYLYNSEISNLYSDSSINIEPLRKNTFTGCIRGFSGIENLSRTNVPESLSFAKTSAQFHRSSSRVQNLSSLFAREFFKKLKSLYAPDFQGTDFDSDLNQVQFIKQIKDFYSSKGTDESIKILFRVLYGEESKIIKPQEFLFKPSDADYLTTKKIVVQHFNPLYRNRNSNEFVNVPDIKRIEGSSLVQSSPRASVSISRVDEFRYKGESYYLLSVPTDQRTDTLQITKRTRLTSPLAAKSKTITVDSTISFPSRGTLFLGGRERVTYNGKTFNQFLNVSNFTQNYSYGDEVSEISTAYAYAFDDPTLKIDLQINGVLQNFDVPDDYNLLRSGDVIRVGQQGINKKPNDSLFNSWLTNTSVNFEIKEIVNTTTLGNYLINTKSDHNFIERDLAEIVFNDSSTVSCKINSVINSTTFTISDSGDLDFNRILYIRRKILFGNSELYPSIEKYTTDVQNVYDRDGDAYVASGSIPFLGGTLISPSNRSINWQGLLSGVDIQITSEFIDHGFYSGEIVKFTLISGSAQNLISGKNYYVKRVNSTTIRFSNSLVDLVNERYVAVSGNGSFKVELPFFSNKVVETQRLLKKIPHKPNYDGGSYETTPGTIGILINGVEIQNYKSSDKVYYGPIKSVDVLGGGQDYDVINPPSISFESENGSGAVAVASVEGSLKKIEIIDPGFDYVTDAKISISGGNGRGATAEVRMESFKHFINFNAASSQIDLSNNIIGFTTFHKFENGESVIYRTFGRTPIGVGTTTLINNTLYYVSRVGPSSIALSNDRSDAINQINLLDLTSTGSGIQRFEAVNLKKRVGEIIVTNSGSGYSNKKRLIPSSRIVTSTGIIEYEKHDFSDGDLVLYRNTSIPIGGLINNNYYHVLKIDGNKFRLSYAGSNLSTISDLNYRTGQYIGINSIGSGSHIFNYPPISVSIDGEIGIKKSSQEDYTAKIRPIFGGKITSINLENSGSGYGYDTILNNPKSVSVDVSSVTVQSAYKAVLNEDGSIVDVIITKKGRGYVSAPQLRVFGDGVGADLVAVSSGSSIASVRIANGGVGYSTSNITIEEILPGFGAKFFVNLTSWTVNEVKKNENNFSNDDLFLTKGDNERGIKITSLYAPRELRKNLKQKNSDGSINYTQNDLIFTQNIERLSGSHSPIVGWSYDGNPIYGPYGYKNNNGGPVKLMTSGYSLKSSRTEGPPTSAFPLGFFTEDYEFLNTGDLDEKNGRFCITPDFPNGVYAYFSTVSKNINTKGSFKNYREPQFPYLVGNLYAANPDRFNLNKSNSQNININNNLYHRNNYYYKLNDKFASYDGIYQSNFDEESEITFTTKGKVNGFVIENGGDNYEVGETLVLDTNSTKSGSGFAARITGVLGPNVVSIGYTVTEIENVIFTYDNFSGDVTGYTNSPHNLLDGDIVSITGVTTNSLENLNGQHRISISQPVYSLSTGIGTTGQTGIVTSISVNGPDITNLNNIAPNDIISFGSEQMLVLNIDAANSKLRVLRRYSGTGGNSISSGNKLRVLTKKINFNLGISTNIQTFRNLPYYFNPSESVALGTSFGVGIGSTIRYSLNVPGGISTERFIPTRTIYLEGHKFKTGQPLTYSNGSGSSIQVSNGSTTFPLQDNSTVYAISVNSNLLGISTTFVGIGSTGKVEGIGSPGTRLRFVSYGSGTYHSFTPLNPEFKGTVEKIIATVVCEEDHNLSLNDEVRISLSPGISTTFYVKYDKDTKLTVFNELQFGSSAISIDQSKITINSHNFSTGDKVLYTSSNEAAPLKTKRSYFVIKIDKNNFRLSDNFYKATKQFPEFINFTSTGGASQLLSKINPQLNATKGYLVVFDLSDSSLSQSSSGNSTEIFDFNLYKDNNFTVPYYSNEGSDKFNVVKIGKVGIGSAKVQFEISDDTPEQLFYRLEPKFKDTSQDFYKSPTIDTEVINYSCVQSKQTSLFNTFTNVIGIGSTTFKVNLTNEPEKNNYTNNQASIIKFSTTSTNLKGPIANLQILSPGFGYEYPPVVVSAGTSNNTSALIKLLSSDAGILKSYNLKSVGFNYSSDLTLRPFAVFPQTVALDSLSKLNSISVSFGGSRYTVPPNLIVVDSITNEEVDGFVIDVTLSGTSVSNVKILQTPQLLFSVPPRIIATNNSNGIGIQTVTFNSNLSIVTLKLSKTFEANKFPFAVGSKIFVENVGIVSTGSGYNSSDYKYQYFTVSGISTTNSEITYKIPSKTPGTFNLNSSSPKVILSTNLPTFSVSMKLTKFNKNEKFYVGNSNYGEIISIDENNKIAKVITEVDYLKKGDIIVGQSSKSSAIVNDANYVESFYRVRSSSVTIDGWQRDTGKLSDETQKIHDSDYYQLFSYSIQSPIPKRKWENIVDATSHSVGFKNFADLQIISIPENKATVKSSLIRSTQSQ
jgi:hypothetical protein